MGCIDGTALGCVKVCLTAVHWELSLELWKASHLGHQTDSRWVSTMAAATAARWELRRLLRRLTCRDARWP